MPSIPVPPLIPIKIPILILIHSNCFYLQRKTPTPFLPVSLPTPIHHGCSNNALLMRLHAEVCLLLIDSQVVCTSLKAILP